MRILLKLLLFPITLILTVILLICEFICMFGTMLLSILALLLFALALGTMIFLGEVQHGFKIMVLSYLINPYGIPLLASWLIGKIGQMNEQIKAFFANTKLQTIKTYLMGGKSLIIILIMVVQPNLTKNLSVYNPKTSYYN